MRLLVIIFRISKIVLVRQSIITFNLLSAIFFMNYSLTFLVSISLTT